MRSLFSGGLAAALALFGASLPAQATRGQGSGQRSNRPRQVVKIDSVRVAELYVSNRPEDHPQADFAAQMKSKAATDSIYAARSKGVMEFKKITYKSTA